MSDLKRIKSIFSEALGKEGREREAYLDKACSGDLTLKAEVEALLVTADKAGDFLESPILSESTTLDSSAITEGPGTVIGRYKLLERIGEGGMAVVYMAEQERPFRRKVALKIIKLGMDTKSVIARFEAERQALAIMDHPHIAQVYDAGATDTGRPYFVMELVHGMSITAYCDQEKLPTQERLQLFLQVCDAVQHAHQRGIIHRDLKPSNIMVTMHDDVAVPKVIDFGIAKATNQRLTEKTLFTRYAQMIGTPAYMSPEQAQMSGLDIDTRSDIYSLGVLLYELLAGAAPFSDEELNRAGYLEMQRIIREEEPPKPSTKLSTLGATLTDIAKQRCATPELLRKTIRGDLDWIVMKSLEKDRAHRYETPNAFKRDIQRYLQHEPVQARRPATFYRLQKYTYRHRIHVSIALAAVILLGATIGLILMVSQNRRQRHDRVLYQVRESLTDGDLQGAMKAVKPILESKWVGSEARLLYARILVDQGRSDLAALTLHELFDESPQISGAAHALMVRLLWENQSPNDPEGLKAIEEHQRQAEALLPQDEEACFLRALMAITIKEKLMWLEQALEFDIRHYESYRLRALTHQASRKYQALKDDALVMRALKPGDSLGFSLLGHALENMDNYEGALAQYDHAMRLVSPNEPDHARLINSHCAMLLRTGSNKRVVTDARDFLAEFPGKVYLHFHIICALAVLGDYQEANDLFQQVFVAIPPNARSSKLGLLFKSWSMHYVFDCLENDYPWHHPDHRPDGKAYQHMLAAEEKYRDLSTKARPLIKGFSPSWSPDGSRLAFCMGNLGTSGIAVYDIASQKSDLLAVPGATPSWSPDGNNIAFVRDRQVLRLSDLSAAEHGNRWAFRDGGEIWIIAPDGTGLKYLCRGTRPSWSQDSSRILYYSDAKKMLYSVSITDKNTRPQPVMTDLNEGVPLYVSPDGQSVAYAQQNSLNIIDRNTRSSRRRWTGLPMFWNGGWSSTGRYFYLGGLKNFGPHDGVLIFDLERGQAARVLEGQITNLSWSPDYTTLAISLGTPLHKIWLVDLDPNLSTIDDLGTTQTLEEQYQQSVLDYTQRIEVDPEDVRNYLQRAQYYNYLQDEEQVLADMETYVSTVHRMAGKDPHEQGLNDFLRTLWQRSPVNLAPINTSFHEGFPCVSANGLELYFSSDRPGGSGEDDLWVATRPSMVAGWGEPRNLGDRVNSLAWEGSPSLSGDGLMLYFTSDRPSGHGYGDIWMTTRATKNDAWGAPVNLGPSVNTEADEAFVSITADGLQLYIGYYQPYRSGGRGGRDIWMTTRANATDAWEQPRNLGRSVNSPFDDDMPRVSPDGLKLFFASDRPEGYGFRDVWLTWRAATDDPWSPPVNLGPSINTPLYDQAASISADGSMLTLSSMQSGGYGNFDIWQVPIPPNVRIFESYRDTTRSNDSIDVERNVE